MNTLPAIPDCPTDTTKGATGMSGSNEMRDLSIHDADLGMGELEIIARARIEARRALREAWKSQRFSVGDSAELILITAAPIVVATELRKFAVQARYRSTRNWLTSRANQLDPEGVL